MLDQRWRAEVEKGLRPIGSRLRQAGITADQVTLLGLVASAGTGVAIASGHLGWGAAGLACSGVTDVLDGAVAKSGGTSGPRGSFFDSVADRLSDALVLGGAAWYLAGTDPQLSVLPFAVATASFLVSYERSKAEALGFNGKGGLMERAERMAVLGVGLTFGVLIPALWLLLALTSLTVGQRFLKVWQQATPDFTSFRGDARFAGWWLTGRTRADDVPVTRWRWAPRPAGELRG
ncbi:MAG TPA: CDP-alcohol phosphatidyltransferase family protein, partial [Acidimicrobiia bacterium]|nr:CDP-alcohol phosphatidyltransferase family protein [Acidimicrobiia bacterium]